MINRSHWQKRLNHILQAGLLLVLAGMLAWLSTRYTIQADWTRNGRHTLSGASTEILGSLDGPIAITAYAREQQGLRDAITKFVGRYKRVKPDINLRFINPDIVPDEVRNLGISINGELLIRYQGRTEHVRSTQEQAFTNALQRLFRGTERWVAFIEGHGERNPLGKANHDLGDWARQLNQRGFRLQPLNLSETGAVPDNTSVLVIADPAVPLLPGEVALLVAYLERGGNLLWLQDPGNLAGLEPIANYLGIEFPAGTIIDFAGQLIGIDDPTIVLVTGQLYGKHPALDQFALTTLFPTSTGILTKSDSHWKIKKLVSTGDHTWQETGELRDEVKFNQDIDLQGPLNIAISLEKETTKEPVEAKQRIIVIGDGDFLSNTYIGNSGNLELGMRLINWLSHDDDFISIPPLTIADTQLNMPPMAAGMLGIFFLLVLPILLIAAGATVWWQRSKL